MSPAEWWAAFGAVVAVTLGAGGLLTVGAASEPSVFTPINPTRVLDTRIDVGLAGLFVSDAPRVLDVTGTIPVVGADGTVTSGNPVPDGATAIVANVTAVYPTTPGFVSVRPGDATGKPTTSNINFTSGGVIAPNSVTVAVPTSGATAGHVQIWLHGTTPVATSDMVVDIVGYYTLGMAGPEGPQGPAGNDGATGPDGSQGPAGNQGEQGPQGDQGLPGDRGVPGDTGDAGPQGVPGDTGDDGPQGVPGDTGDDGPQGVPGDTGPVGPAGPGDFTRLQSSFILSGSATTTGATPDCGAGFVALSGGVSSDDPAQAALVISELAPAGQSWSYVLVNSSGSDLTVTSHSMCVEGTVSDGGPALSDVLAPVVTSVAVSPLSVDTSTSIQDLTVTVEATDDLSGVDYICVYFYSPTEGQTNQACDYETGPIEGTPTDGTWELTISLPQFSETGVWNLREISAGDLARNYLNLDAQDLIDGGLTTTFTVTGTGTTFVSVTPCRLPDTRPAPDRVGPFGSFSSGEVRVIQASGANGNCLIPADAVGLSLNITAVNATQLTYLTVWPDGAQPTTSSLNAAPGQPPTPNAVATPLSSAGSFNMYNQQGTVDVIVDINGYWY